MIDFDFPCDNCGDTFLTYYEAKQCEEDHAAWSTGDRLQVLREYGKEERREAFWSHAWGGITIRWTPALAKAKRPVGAEVYLFARN